MLTMKKLLLATAAAATLAGVSSAAQARTDVGIVLNFGPPAPLYEPVPAVRLGYTWVPGYWDWRANRHYWVAGHYVRARPGYSYYPGRWAYVDGRYRYDRPHWVAYRDVDRDGIPDHRDRVVRNDRDRDGIPDHRDRYVGHYRNYR
jgi:hypothetical protein